MNKLNLRYMVNEQIEHIEQIKKTMKQQNNLCCQFAVLARMNQVIVWDPWGTRLICLLPTNLLATIGPPKTIIYRL